MPQGKTLFDKIWERHTVATEAEGETLLYVDRCLVHEGARHAFSKLKAMGVPIHRPDLVYGFADHYAPTTNRAAGMDGISDPKIREMVELMDSNAAESGITYFGLENPDQGILHVVGPEQGVTIPGIVIAGSDSHTSTHGAFGTISFGIGASDAAHVMATQCLWQRRPKTMRVTVDGTLGFGVTAKDVILAVIHKIGVDGGVGHAIEYTGSTIRAMTMEQRMTVCNMTIEGGARYGMIAPDDTTFDFVAGRNLAPRGADWDRAVADWRTLPTDEDAVFDQEVRLDAAEIAPLVTWGVNPEQAAPITDAVPFPDKLGTTAAEREQLASALEYMGLKPGQRLAEVAVDRVFIGSCTNGRIEDLRAAAEVASKGRAKIPAWIVPGSSAVKRQAEAEGLDRVFQAAGFEWRDPGCSMCTAINGDHLAPGERCASTSNRNFRGRQGPGGRTHLVSPAMAAAAALSGRLCDVRELSQGTNGGDA